MKAKGDMRGLVDDLVDEILNGSYERKPNPLGKKIRVVRIVDKKGKSFEFTGVFELEMKDGVAVFKAVSSKDLI